MDIYSTYEMIIFETIFFMRYFSIQCSIYAHSNSFTNENLGGGGSDNNQKRFEWDSQEGYCVRGDILLDTPKHS